MSPQLSRCKDSAKGLTAFCHSIKSIPQDRVESSSHLFLCCREENLLRFYGFAHKRPKMSHSLMSFANKTQIAAPPRKKKTDGQRLSSHVPLHMRRVKIMLMSSAQCIYAVKKIRLFPLQPTQGYCFPRSSKIEAAPCNAGLLQHSMVHSPSGRVDINPSTAQLP